MKNNRIKNSELRELYRNAEEIKKLASLDDCRFKNQESVFVQELRIWLQWFDVHADNILKILNTNEEV